MSQIVGVPVSVNPDAFEVRIPTLGDDASIEEALKVYHFGIDNYTNQSLQLSPPVGMAAHLKIITDNIAAINSELDTLPSIYIESISSATTENIIYSDATGITPLKIRSIIGQTSPLLSFHDSSGTKISEITTAGAFSGRGLLASDSTAVTQAVNTNTTAIATTAFVLGQANSTAGTIAMNGTQFAGSSNLYARADHVHPTDTSRSPLAGSSSITTVGTIGSGTWQGSIIAGAYGGTGVANTGKTITVSGNVVIGSTTNTVTFTTSGNTSVALPTSGTLAITGNPLSQFAATTSAQLAVVISDETGTDKLVFNTSPTFVTSIATSSASFNLLDTTATTVNFARAATALTIGATTGTTTIRNANTVVSGDLAVNGGDVTTGATSFNLVNDTATTVNFAGAGTAITIGATTGTTTIRNASTVVTGDLAVNGGDITTSAATFNLVNATATTVNIAGAATTVSLGAGTGTTTINNANTVVTGDLAVNGGDITSSASSFNLLNATVATLNLAGAGTAITIGATTGTTTIRNANTVVTGDLAVNGGDLTTSATTFNLVNTTATTVNFAGAGTSIAIGSSTGTTTVKNNLTVAGNLSVNGTTTTTNAVNLSTSANTISLGSNGADTNQDRGIIFKWNTGALPKIGFFGYDDSSGKFTFIADATNTRTVVNASGTVGSISGSGPWTATVSVASTTGFTVGGTIEATNGTGSLYGGIPDSVTITSINPNTSITYTVGGGTATTPTAGTVTNVGYPSDVITGTKGTIDANIEWADVLSKPDPVITVTLTGDVTGSGNTTLTDLGNGTVSFATTIAANSVELGTDTTGNYVATIGGTTNQVTVFGSGSETAAVTLSLPQDIHTGANPTFAGATLDLIRIGVTAGGEIDTSSGNLTIDSAGGTVTVDDNLTVSGNLTVNGTTVTVNATTMTVDDPIITLGGDTAPVADDNKDRGIEFRYYDTQARIGFMGWDDSSGKFILLTNATNTSEVFSGTKATLDANVEWADILSKPDPVVTVTLTGDVTGTGNATLTDLGNGTISFATTIAANSVALGTDTTGNYIATGAVSGNGLSGSATGEGSTFTVTSNATNLNTASTIVFRDSSGNFSAGTITAALSGNATSATNTGITNDTASNATMYPTWVTATTGNLPQKTTSTKLTFNPSTGTLAATAFSGSGASLTSLNAGNLSTGTISSAILGNSTLYVGTSAVALNRASANQALTGISSVSFPGATSGAAILQAQAVAGTPTLSLPVSTGTLIGTGDTGTVSNVMIANDAVTYAKIQNISAQYRVLGRISAAAGDTEELTGENLVTVLGQATSKTGSGNIVFATSPTISTSIIGSATMAVFNTASTTINAFGAATSLNIGGTPTTAATANIMTNATASGQTKTLNVGTGSAAGSTTNINIGSTLGTSTTTVNGALVVSSPTASTHAATKGYVDSVTINAQTASYILAASDAGKVIEIDVASPNTITVPSDSVSIPVNTTIDIVQMGDGETSLLADSGVTIRSSDGALKFRTKYSAVTLYKRGANDWVAMGDLII